MYRLLGDFAKARENYQLAMNLSQKLKDETSKALSLTNLALLSQAEGNLPEAVSGFSQALITYRRTGDQRAQIVNETHLVMHCSYRVKATARCDISRRVWLWVRKSGS